MYRVVSIIALLVLLSAGTAMAHFGMIIPSTDEVTQDSRSVDLTLSFSHPFEGIGMNLVKPEAVDVYFEGEKTSLLDTMKETKVMDHQSWTLTYQPKRPGLYAFVMEPVAYPEPAEDNFIIHYTKVYVDAFGEGEEWNQPLGLKTEIVPLTRPFGNYAGNVFQGVVLLDGKPAPYTRVEVEIYNEDLSKSAPNDRMVTQEVLCDGNGVFTFACPWKGWWGFAALNDADYQIEGKDVELGAVLWVKMQ